jgi:hypothetical protein
MNYIAITNLIYARGLMIAFENMGRMFEANQAGLDLDRLRNNLESARGRLEWFKARGMKNAADQGLRLFPELSNESSNPKPRVGVQLQVLGMMQIAHEFKTESVRGQKRKELLAILLEARILGRSEVTMLELFDAIYPNVSESEAASGLKQTVFKVRSSYGQNTITTTANGYALGAITSDAETFLRDSDTQLWQAKKGDVAATRISSVNNDNSPCVLPDGRIVSLWLDRPGNSSGAHELRVVNADGSNPQMLLTGQNISDIGIGCGK